MIVACLAVAAVFISCEKVKVNTLDGDQSPIGQVGTTFSLLGNVSDVSNASAQVVSLDDGVSTISLSANITNPDYLSMLSSLSSKVDISGTTVKIDRQYRFTDAGIQSVYPNGEVLNVIKYNAKVGDVYTIKRGAHTIHREVTVVSNKDEYSWNGLLIKTIHVKETGRGVPGLDYVEYVTNHKFGLVALKIFFEDGTSLNIYGKSSVTN